MSLSSFLVWVIAFIFITIVPVIIKIFAEIRLKQTARAEMNIKLVKLFTEVMDIANARRESYFSEKAIEYVLKNFKSDGKLEDELKNGIIIAPVGASTQNAAISGVFTLGLKYKILRRMAVEALENLKNDQQQSHKDSRIVCVINNYINILKKKLK